MSERLHNAEDLAAMGYTPEQVRWLLARSDRSGYLTASELERLLPDLPIETEEGGS